LGKFNKVSVHCGSLYHLIKAPKLVSAKVHTTSWSFLRNPISFGGKKNDGSMEACFRHRMKN